MIWIVVTYAVVTLVIATWGLTKKRDTVRVRWAVGFLNAFGFAVNFGYAFSGSYLHAVAALFVAVAGAYIWRASVKAERELAALVLMRGNHVDHHHRR